MNKPDNNIFRPGKYLLIMVIMTGYYGMNPSFASVAKTDVTIMSFNIRLDIQGDGENRWDNRKEAILTMLNEKAPSVIGIQEGLEDQVNYLEENLDAYAKVGAGRDDGESGGEQCAVFYLKSQFELLNSQTFWLSETPDEPSYGWDAAYRRVVTWVKLKDIETGKIFYVFNTHFDNKGPEAREKSALLLVEKINQISDPKAVIFITGDFNAQSEDPILDPILDEFKDSRCTAKLRDDAITYNDWGKSAGERIDFIFYRQAKAKMFDTIDEDFGVPYISDHYPVMSSFVF